MNTITVKGIGSVSVKPDLTVISILLESVDIDYDRAMSDAAGKIADVQSRLEQIGFEKTDIKTLSYNVDTRYENERDSDGNYVRKFKGYACSHRLNLEFDFDAIRLAEVLQAIAGCAARPELNINFTVKDADAVSDDLLRAATVDAKKKAETICSASGVQLGSLISIDYNVAKLNMVSDTRYAMDNDCMAAPRMRASKAAIDFVPNDIKVKDCITFVWEIK